MARQQEVITDASSLISDLTSVHGHTVSHIYYECTGLPSVICHINKCVLLYSPFEELHKQADIEQASEDEEQTVP